MKFIRRGDRRIAISELVGALLMVAITLIAGTAVFAFVRQQAGVSEGQYAQTVGNDVALVRESLVITDMNFGTPCSPCKSTTFWFYNSGLINLQLAQVRLYDSAGQINLLYTYSASGKVKTDTVYDLKLYPQCSYTNSYESPLRVSQVNNRTATTQMLTLTIPPTKAGCTSGSSFGNTFNPLTTYSVTVTAFYGSTVTYSQKM